MWALLAILAAVGCAPTTQAAAIPPSNFTGPRFSEDQFITHDGVALGLTVTRPANGEPAKAIIIALHGMNDYAATWDEAALAWANLGYLTYAYDARGFGRSPNRGVWGGQQLMTEDVRTAVAVARRQHPGLSIALVGTSMGAATIMAAHAERPPNADRVVLLAPAVWGWSNLPFAYRSTLWVTARLIGGQSVTPPRAVTTRIQPSNNIEMLRRIGRDQNMLFETRIDAIYGLVHLMEAGFQHAQSLPADRTLVLFGQNDQVVPRRAFETLVSRLPPGTRTVDYPDGWHMLERDLQAARVHVDIAAFIEDRLAKMPSGTAAFGALAEPQDQQEVALKD